MQTPLCARLGLDVPIVQAPMAGGWTTPELVAAVCNAGGLGMLAAARLSLEQLRGQIDAVRRLTTRPFGVNFLLAAPGAAPADASGMQRVLDAGRAQRGLAPGSAALALPPSALAAQFELACDARVPVVGFAMGDPAPLVPRAQAAGAFVIAMATSVAEARRLEAGGVDAIVAQGSEAGGHRSCLEPPGDTAPPLIGTMALLPQVVDAVRVPVIATGGLMDGRGVLAALVLGAQAAQLGTRFLLALEAGTFPAYRQRLIEADETDTVVTRALTGWPARAVRNSVVRAVEAAGEPPLGWPYQALAAEDLYRAAIISGDADWAPLLAGQGLRLARGVSSAAEIVAALKAEIAAGAERLGAGFR
ncbi:nitronate monooxygenase [Aquincola sp. S2]|uniref:Propionate 3-nitronate monooxygenase n=1 Tax=Pseudaquabacterium terrae TaxID=2732868 RepID=A0ABX2EPT4_9BURK|nr:nitronate monooxygenase [Aquabacterium terrae]NRF70603.1 nitronate monooxygenase [Aquabacterium terrae]